MGCMVFACHAYPGLASLRHQGRSWFAEVSGMVGPAGDFEEMITTQLGN
jgi:hypothetical protein